MTRVCRQHMIRDRDGTMEELLYGVAQGGELCKDGWRAYIVYITSSRRTVWLGSLKGLYERFPIRNLIR